MKILIRRRSPGLRGARAGLLACATIAALAGGGCFSSSSTSDVATTDGGLDATAPADDSGASDAPVSPATDGSADAPDVVSPAMDASADATSDAAPDVGSDAAGDAGDAGDASADAADGAIPVVPLVTGTYAAGAAWGPSSGSGYPGGVWGGQTVTFDTSGALLSITNASWTISTTVPPFEYGADGLVAWGRWAAGTTTMSGSPVATVALNYIAGVQAPSAGVLHASYSVFASTAPTSLPGDAGTLVGTSNAVTGTVSVSGQTVTVALDHITVGGHTFAIAGSAGLYATTGLLLAGTVTSSTGGCPSGCAGSITNAGAVQGWFLGSSGERAALDFAFSSSVGDVSGAVVLK